MKIRDNGIIIETFDEAYEIFYGPSCWDMAPGGIKCSWYAAYHMAKMSESKAALAHLEFATPKINEYWLSLVKCNKSTPWYNSFDFNLGVECQNGNDNRPKDNIYLKAAKYISVIGIDKFLISNKESFKSRQIIFTKKSYTTKSFIFEDIVDPSMYESAKALIDEIELINYRLDSQLMLDDFISDR